MIINLQTIEILLFFIYFNKIVSYNSCGTVNWLRSYNEVRNSVHNKKGISLYILIIASENTLQQKINDNSTPRNYVSVHYVQHSLCTALFHFCYLELPD